MFLIHPEHGATNVNDFDAIELKKQGWKEATVDEWFRMNGKEHLCASPEPEKQEPEKRKPGRPKKVQA